MNAFAAGSAYDPAVNTISTFTAVSFAEPAVKVLSPPDAGPMFDAGETGRGNNTFTADAKMVVCATVRFGGEAGYHRQITV